MSVPTNVFHLQHKFKKTRYNVHPVTILSILDHHKRRNKDSEFVVGTLYGNKINNEYCVRTSSPDLYEKKDDGVIIDERHNGRMLDLTIETNKDEEPIGWYCTSDGLNDNTDIIFRQYDQLLKGNKKKQLIVLFVDVTLKNKRLNILGYYKVELKFLTRYDPCDIRLDAHEEEKIALESFHEGQTEDDALDAPVSLINDAGVNALEGIKEHLQRINDEYLLNDKIDKNSPKNIAIGQKFADIVSKVPRMSTEKFEKVFTHKSQDLLMVQYLSSITKTQIAISNKINTILLDRDDYTTYN